MSFLSPSFLVSNMSLISLLTAIMLLVFFGSWVNNNVIFPVSDMVRKRTHHSVKRRLGGTLAKYLSEGLATIIFGAYCYFGSTLLAKYVLQPILSALQAFLLIVVIILFLLFSYIINSPPLRKWIMK